MRKKGKESLELEDRTPPDINFDTNASEPWRTSVN
jgi:hypothetical protein